MNRFILVHTTARNRAIHAVLSAPNGYVVTIKEPVRSSAQNDKMWAMLTDVAAQLNWHGQTLDENDWKLIFMSSLYLEMRIVPNWDNNGFVNLTRSSKLGIKEMANLISLIEAYGYQRGVKFGADATKESESA